MGKKQYFLIFLVLLVTVAAYSYFFNQTENQGHALYQSQCSSCHGFDGKGGIGLPLNSPKLSTQLSDDYLKSTISLGRSGRIMPAFENSLSTQEIDQIVEYMRSWQKDPSQRVTYSKQNIAGDFKKGEAIYKDNCKVCHGANLGGDSEGTGVTLSRERTASVAAPALANPGFLGSVKDEMILHVVYQGRKGSPMPSFKDQGLTREQLKDVVHYVRKRGSVLSAQWQAKENQGGVDPIFTLYESSYDFATTKDNIYNAIKAANFRAYKPRLLEQDLQDTTLPVDKNKQVYRFCNFQMLSEFLKVEPRLGVFLPCNVTVIKTQEDKVMVSIPNLRRIIPMFNNKRLNERAAEVEELLVDMVEEALL